MRGYALSGSRLLIFARKANSPYATIQGLDKFFCHLLQFWGKISWVLTPL